ncbi:T9SS type A sorting domain-containing protein [Wenyingzhuangia sp. 1_MG-2023]|nr:T9SS type A sorting domain-containing protein [Wenyingzhuangia sp. 1_MG-2023]
MLFKVFLQLTLPTDNIEFVNASMVAYPNPVTSSFQIDSSIAIENVKLYNITGRLLKTFNGNGNYDVSDLATGIYFAKIKTPFGFKTLKVIKE